MKRLEIIILLAFVAVIYFWFTNRTTYKYHIFTRSGGLSVTPDASYNEVSNKILSQDSTCITYENGAGKIITFCGQYSVVKQ